MVQTYTDFCTQLPAAACAFEQRCGFVDPAVSDCAPDEVFVIQGFPGPTPYGCSADNAAKVSSGTVTYAPSAGTACLAALSDPSCSTAALFAACDSTTVLQANSPFGGPCDLATDCLPLPDGGQPLCNQLTGSLGCSGVCSFGFPINADCTANSILGCDPSQGRCEEDDGLPDGGGGTYCQPFVPDGGSCFDTTYVNSCDPITEYCADAGLANNICQPVGPPGSLCDVNLCAGAPAQCPCGPLACIPTALDGGGVCGPVGIDTPCVGSYFPSSCGNTNESFGVYISCQNATTLDGGTGSYCLTETGRLGQLCDSTRQCIYPLSCDSVSHTCVIPSGPEQPCTPNSTNPCTDPFGCNLAPDGGYVCTTTSPGQFCMPGDGNPCLTFDYCAPVDGGGLCSPQLAVGAACDPTLDSNGDGSCLAGFCTAAADGGNVCATSLTQGQPCNGTSNSQCPDGYCHGLSDGGSYCTQGICGD